MMRKYNIEICVVSPKCVSICLFIFKFCFFCLPLNTHSALYISLQSEMCTIIFFFWLFHRILWWCQKLSFFFCCSLLRWMCRYSRKQLYVVSFVGCYRILHFNKSAENSTKQKKRRIIHKFQSICQNNLEVIACIYRIKCETYPLLCVNTEYY